MQQKTNPFVSPYGGNQNDKQGAIKGQPAPSLFKAKRQTAFLWSYLLEHQTLDTMKARRMGINHIAGRINDLRNLGAPIETHSTETIDQKGKVVKCALYVLSYNPQLSLLSIQQEMNTRKEVKK